MHDEQDIPYEPDWLAIVVSVLLCLFFAGIFIEGMT